ncbi:hypothetical protein [Streptomyces sp. NPDC052042]|uniref:hypothetical protein n=1 Tax=Streptomyces sp. NPDC052042 TaxID=3365683 RepID=UPI0037D1B64A
MKYRSLTVGIATAAALTLAGGATAQAAGETAAESTAVTAEATTDNTMAAKAALCTLWLGKPGKTYGPAPFYALGTYKTVNNCNAHALIATLQYHRWHGWTALKSDSWVGNRKATNLKWNCTGQGNHNYRMSGVVNPKNGTNVGYGNGPSNRFTC